MGSIIVHGTSIPAEGGPRQPFCSIGKPYGKKSLLEKQAFAVLSKAKGIRQALRGMMYFRDSRRVLARTSKNSPRRKALFLRRSSPSRHFHRLSLPPVRTHGDRSSIGG